MRRSTKHPLAAITFLIMSASASCALAAAEPKPLFATEGPVVQGWTTRDWEDVSKPPKWPVQWQVRKGELWGTGHYSTGNSGDKWIGTWLLSEAEYGDFILELEFKFKNGGRFGNGGVALRAPLKGDPAYEGLELQITDPQFEYSYFPEAGHDELTGALYLVAAPTKLMYRAGEWNRYRIELRGPKVKVTLNGTTVQDIDLDSFTRPARKHGKGQEFLDATPGAQRPRRGHIGLQDLSENGEVLLFRNVKVTELK
jgi:hypothetical protein